MWVGDCRNKIEMGKWDGGMRDREIWLGNEGRENGGCRVRV